MLVFPGDEVPQELSPSIKLGPGLGTETLQDGQVRLSATAPGILGQVSTTHTHGRGTHGDDKQPLAFWVESNNQRYVPSMHDHVLCQITNRGAESYQVLILNSYTTASLAALSFEGATKRNKPNLKVGTLLYAQVISASRHFEVEVSCVDLATGKSNGFGELKAERPDAGKSSSDMTAMIWSVSCGLARSLLQSSHPLLNRVAAHFPFEVAIGVNGYVWVRAQSPRHVIAVGKVLEQADNNPPQPGVLPDALTFTKQRGVLSTSTIAKIVEPFK